MTDLQQLFLSTTSPPSPPGLLISGITYSWPGSSQCFVHQSNWNTLPGSIVSEDGEGRVTIKDIKVRREDGEGNDERNKEELRWICVCMIWCEGRARPEFWMEDQPPSHPSPTSRDRHPSPHHHLTSTQPSLARTFRPQIKPFQTESLSWELVEIDLSNKYCFYCCFCFSLIASLNLRLSEDITLSS